MCSSSYSFIQTMENYQGDLIDIVRASGGGGGGGGGSIPPNDQPISSPADWKFPSDLMNFQSEAAATDDFGDPFSDMRDPLLHELHIGSSSSSASGGGGSDFFFNPHDSSTSCIIDGHDRETSTVFGVPQKTINVDDQMMMMKKNRPSSSPCNIFSRMLQISPNSKTTTATCSPCDSSPVVVQQLQPPRESVINANSLSKPGCILDSTTGLQISSPRNPGIKRRKSQAKKVVCIPAPAPANSRPSGEIVPSDLWAWRKYGQKPIKGSPYPRGYYRCSSSKGCSARKQVERSRTDPNMLVITYTSEHNHPWPTQRNALAGSTRAQPSKNNNAASHSQKTALDEEFKDCNKDINISSTTVAAGSSSASVKEEMEDTDEKELDMDEGEGDHQFSEGFPPSYKPTMPVDQDFFADLDEIEGDPLSLLLNQEFRLCDDDQEREAKALDPFSIFDCWPGSINNNNTSFGEAKRGL